MEKKQWSEQDLDALIKKKIEEYNTSQGRTVSSFTVPLHRHNGSDMVRINMSDIQYDGTGLIFPLRQGNADIRVGDDNVSLVEEIAGPGAYFGRELVDTTSGIVTATIEDDVSTSIVTSGTSWYLRLPDNSILPAAPQVGDICIFGGILQVCEVAGVWTPK